MNDTFILNVNKLYGNKTYLEKYGHSVAITIIILLAFFFIFGYFYIRANIEPIKKDWDNLKCHPGIIPFAGMINRDPNDSVFESTGKNFSACTKIILKSVVDISTKPIASTVDSLNAIFKKILKSGGMLQKLMANTFEKINRMMLYFIQRLGGVLIPVQKLFINIKDTMKKMNGVLSTFLFTLVAQFYAMKSFVGSMIDMLIVGMIAASAAIVALWLLPFTWPVAVASTVFYVVIMTLLIIIKVNMARILSISSGAVPPKPGKPSFCFHKDTIIQTLNGDVKISELKPGDKLLNGDYVTGIFKSTGEKSRFYDLDGVFVTGNHHVYNKDIGWIRVENDPRAVMVPDMKEKYVYCLNTYSKQIHANNNVFMDWDEVDTIDILTLKNKKYIYTKEDINYYLNSGFFADTLIELKDGTMKKIQDLKVGEILKNDIKITGVVKSIDHKKTYNYLNTMFNIKGNNIMFEKDNLAKYDKKFIKKDGDKQFLYHIITDKTYFFIKNIKIFDYNSCLEHFLYN